MRTNVIKIIGIIVTNIPTIIETDFTTELGSSLLAFNNGILFNLSIKLSYDYLFITPHHTYLHSSSNN